MNQEKEKQMSTYVIQLHIQSLAAHTHPSHFISMYDFLIFSVTQMS